MTLSLDYYLQHYKYTLSTMLKELDTMQYLFDSFRDSYQESLSIDKLPEIDTIRQSIHTLCLKLTEIEDRKKESDV